MHSSAVAGGWLWLLCHKIRSCMLQHMQHMPSADAYTPGLALQPLASNLQPCLRLRYAVQQSCLSCMRPGDVAVLLHVLLAIQ